MNLTIKKILSHAFLVFIGLFILSPIIWVVLASFTEATQAPFMIERIFSPEKISSSIEANKLTLEYKIKSLNEKKEFTFGKDLANKYITIEYLFRVGQTEEVETTKKVEEIQESIADVSDESLEFKEEVISDDVGDEIQTEYKEHVDYTVSDNPLDMKTTEKVWIAHFKLDGNGSINNDSYRVNKKALLTFFNVITISNYRDILWEAKFRAWLANSFIIALLTSLLSVALAFFAGYAFSRYKFPGRKVSLMWVLATQLFPLAMMIVPIYLLAAKVLPAALPGLQITNTRWGLILVYSATALPFSIWMLKGYFDTIPIDLEEAAFIDGASLWQMLMLVLLPITRPAMFTAFLFAFVQSWNEYAVASMFLTDPNKLTLPVGLQSMMGGAGSYNQQISLFAAGAVIVSIPIIILFMSMKKELVEGATLGAVKG